MIENIKELHSHNIWRTCNKIRAALTRINLNIWKCFTPFDTQLNNLISESDFITVLSGRLGKLIGLSSQEVCELADYFRCQDGRIFYSQFCAIIHKDSPKFENNFPWVSGEEWEDPFQSNCLGTSEHRTLEIILTKIASVINKRKLVLRPYFQDYELISNNCGSVTFAHFGRILHFLKITLAPEEIHLLIKKFAKDAYTINYVSFIQAVEEAQDFLKKHDALDNGGDLLDNFPGRVISVKLPKLPRPEIGKIRTSCVFPKQLHFLPIDTSTKRIRDIYEIMLRLQDHVYKNQIQVAKYFQDFDVFNVGKITNNQFRRGLCALQQSALGKLHLAEEEIEELIAFYKDPNDAEKFCWRTFEDDVEQVYTVKHLHKHPNCKVSSPPAEVKMLPRKGYQEWDCTDRPPSKEVMEKVYKKTLQKIIHRLKERRFSLRLNFQDFDKQKRGHISRAQLRQALAIAAIPLTGEEISSLEFMHNNDIGFHYLDFIGKLEQLLNESPFYDKEESESKTNTLEPSTKQCPTEENNIDLILAKIKAKVVCTGIKVSEFIRRFDTRNVRVVTRLQFHRGLDQLKCDLTCTEVKTLMDHYALPDRPEYIDYWKFCETVEGAMAQGHLEKLPLARPVRHVPSGATPRSFLNFDERQILVRTLNVLVAYVNSNLEELFKDFDKDLNIGTVTKNQLIRALSVRNIMSSINAKELDVVFKCFSVGNVKAEPQFDYRSFLNALHIISENKNVVPF